MHLATVLSRPPFVGRSQELQALRQVLSGAGDGGGRLVALVGEAGMGKTRLLGEVARVASSQGALPLWSQMIEEPGAPPYFAWTLVLRAGLQRLDDDSLREDLGSGAGDVAAILPELRDRLALEPGPAASEGVGARFQLFDAVTRLLLRIAVRQPLVLLLDNLHRADPSSLALLEYLVQHIPGSAVTVVAAFRESELSRQHPLRPVLGRLSRATGFVRLGLAGLPRDDVAELLQAQAGRGLPATFVRKVHALSDGNPLFVTEIGSMVAQAGPDAPVTGAGFHFKVPESLREVIAARLDDLPAATCELLGLAAVAGRDFDLRLLAELGACSPERAARTLQNAERAGVVTGQGPGRYAFAHALFREVLYAEHSTVRRVSLHRKAGEHLEARYGDDPDPHLSRLAHHFFEAAHAGEQDKAVRYCRAAAEAALGNRAYGEAVALFECALQVLELDDSAPARTRFDILHHMGRAQYQAGQLNAATGTLMKAALAAYRCQWWWRLADALCLFQFVCQQSGYRHVSSIPLHAAVLEHLPEGDVATRARVMASMANAYRTNGEPQQAAATFNDAVALARDCGDQAVLLHCLRKGNWTIGRSPAGVDKGLLVSREALSLAMELGATEAVLDSVVDVIFQLCDLGHIDEVQQQLVTLRDLAAKERQPHFENMLLGFETSVAILQGRWSDALRGAQQGVRRLPSQDVFGLRGRFGFQVFAIKRMQGTLGQVQDVAERIIATSGASALWAPGQILLHCELGQQRQARATLQQLGELRELPRDDMYAIALAFLADACISLRDVARCAVLFELLQPYRGLNVTLPGTLMLGAASGFLARLAAITKRGAEARTLFDEAIEMNASMGAMPALAETQLACARLLLGSGREPDRVQAIRLLARARSIGEQHDLRPVLAEFDALSTSAGVESLTGRELDVLRTMATGASNGRIADTLNISHSTVATHVRHIFRKIGVTNRTEAADFARRSGLLGMD